jgi:hypothetical protein
MSSCTRRLSRGWIKWFGCDVACRGEDALAVRLVHSQQLTRVAGFAPPFVERQYEFAALSDLVQLNSTCSDCDSYVSFSGLEQDDSAS